MTKSEQKRQLADVTSIRGTKLFGLFLILTFFVGFGYWAITAPLSGAVVASGWVTKEGRTQALIHERGGVIANILVKEGQAVRKGDNLVLIEDSDRRAEKEQIESKIAYLSVREARLMAEEKGETFDPSNITSQWAERQADQAYDQFIKDQVKEFAVRADLKTQEAQILQKQRAALSQELKGLEQEVESMEAWRAILKEQVTMRTTLLKKGAVSKVALQETKKDLAEVETAYQKLSGQLETLPYRLSELDARLERIDDDFAEKVARELSQLRSEKITLQKRLNAALTAVARVELVAPTNGIVDKLHINTVGSAVAAFQPIIEIVPEDNPILVEVEVNPADIEQVRIGQKAKLMLSAFDPTEVPPVNAKVKFVSPDRRVNPQTQIAYYVARLELSKQQDHELPQIVPGMPIEAYMETHERTFLQILIDPLTKSLRRSFRS